MKAVHRPRWLLFATTLAAAVVGPMPPSVQAQTKPWLLFLDSQSPSRCDVVNADNAELVVLQGSGQLVLVTGVDVTLQDAIVDEDGFVSFEGEPAGVIDFADDGNGLRTLWWMSLTGTVVSVNSFTGTPSSTNKVPDDYVGVPCDACEFWDDPSVCDDPPPPVTIPLCGLDVPITVAFVLSGLMGLRLVRRRGLT